LSSKPEYLGSICQYLPRELGCGSGMPCWRRRDEWMQAGVWQNVHEAVMRQLREHDQHRLKPD
jgi:transposase